jgi:hypothetical protein
MKKSNQPVGLKDEKILQLLKAVQVDRIFINVGLPGVDLNYRTKLLSVDNKEDTMFFAPLEPANGNMKIRGSRGEGAVSLSFVYKNQTYQGNVTFSGVMISNGRQLLQCNFPHLLHPTAKVRRREENRVTEVSAFLGAASI